MDKRKIINRLSLLGIGGNILLTGFKLLAGITGRSGAMVSDAVHSLSDVLATLVAYIGSVVSDKQPDDGHPYGHERFECIASLILGVLLAVTGAGIGYAGLKSIFARGADTAVPGLLPLIAAVVSIIVKEAMYRYTMHWAIKLDSDVFKADAHHHRSDALSSVGSLAGIAAARLGMPVMDSIAAVVICVFILKTAADIIGGALSKMTDSSCEPSFIAAVRQCVLEQEEIIRIDLLQTRQFGARAYVDVEIAVDKNSSLIKAHDIAEAVHGSIERGFPKVKHVMVHVNPFMGGEAAER